MDNYPSTQYASHHAPSAELNFEFDAAVKRLGGNRKLFITLAQRFEIDVRTLLGDIGAQLAASDPNKAIMTMHNLKGIGGTLGAVTLAQKAAEIEARLKRGESHQNCAQIIEHLLQLLDQTCAALHQYLDQSGVSVPTAVPISPQGKLPTLKALFEELDLHLAGANMQATETVTILQARLGDQKIDQHSMLADAVHRLDFKLALRLSKQLQNRPQ